MIYQIQGVHYIREFEKNQIIIFLIRKNQRKKKDFPINRGTSGRLFQFHIASFQNSDFLHTPSRIQLIVIVTRFYPFLYHSVLSRHCEVQFHFVMKL